VNEEGWDVDLLKILSVVDFRELPDAVELALQCPSMPCNQKASSKPWEVLVQTAGEAKTSPIYKDALFIEQNGIPDGRCGSMLEPESAEIERTLADAVHQLDAMKAWSRHS
jgi:hypothetical protein